MIRAIRVELTRLRWRRAVVLLLAACILVPAGIFAAVAFDTRPVTDAALADAQRQVDQEANDPFYDKELDRCERRPGRYGVQGEGDLADQCAEMVLPQLDWFLFREPLDLEEQTRESGIAAIAILGALVVLVGATFAGHDWASGSMSNQLLFENRRTRTWFAKAGAVLLLGLVTSGAVLTAYWGGLWLLAEQRGLDPSGAVVRATFEQGLRGTLLIGAAGLGGYAATMLFRSTVATLAVVFAVSVAAPLLIGLVAFPDYQRYQPQNAVLAIANDGIVLEDYEAMCGGTEPGFDAQGQVCTVEVTLAHSAGLGGSVLLVTGLASLIAFRRRDVP